MDISSRAKREMSSRFANTANDKHQGAMQLVEVVEAAQGQAGAYRSHCRKSLTDAFRIDPLAAASQ
jgi:hypothetical protein